MLTPEELLEEEPEIVGPQEGPQEKAMASSADIVIFGGEAGGGKTWWLLGEGARHIDVPGYNCAIFRRVMPQIRNPGGMWDESMLFYPGLGGRPYEGTTEWHFEESGATIKFSGLQYEPDVQDWAGSQVCTIGFDQLEQFTEYQFFYMLSRNRSTCGIRPCVRATCNPDADSWLAAFVSWWIGEDGYPDPAKDGVIRWMIRVNGHIHWGDSREELRAQFPNIPDEEFRPKTVTFIASSVYDNKILQSKDPGYVGNLMALPPVERERLLGQRGRRGGNWKIRAMGGTIFNRAWFEIIDSIPEPTNPRWQWIRYWDKAGTGLKQEDKKRAYTAGTLMGKLTGLDGKPKLWVIASVVRGQWGAQDREAVIRQTAETDGVKVVVWQEQEPGSGGKESAEATVRNLAGFRIHTDRVTGDKFERAGPLSAQAEARNVKLLRGSWNEVFLQEVHAFGPDNPTVPKDQADSASGAFNKLAASVRWGISDSKV